MAAARTGGGWRWAAAAVGLLAAGAHAQVLLETPPDDLKGVDIVEHRGAQVPLDTPLMDSAGRAVRLGDYFDGRRPVVLLLAYYTCPMLCNMSLGDLQRAVMAQKLELGKDYRVLTLSFDHRDAMGDAGTKRSLFTNGVGAVSAFDAAAAAGAAGPADDPWPFLLATEQNAKLVADSVGFTYRLIPQTGEYAHATVLVVLSPSGTVSNYLYGRYGKQFDERQMRLALGDAADGKVGTIFDKILFWCYHYDPDSNSYTVQAWRVMRAGGLATMTLLFGTIGVLFWTGRRRHSAAPGGG